MSLNNNKNWHQSRVIQSLLLIIALQLVVLQVKALSMPHAINQGPCSEMSKSHHEHSQKSGTVVVGEERAEDDCPHCGVSSLDCHNSCYSASLIALVFDIVPDLENTNDSLDPASIKTLVGTSLQFTFRPPRLLTA